MVGFRVFGLGCRVFFWKGVLNNIVGARSIFSYTIFGGGSFLQVYYKGPQDPLLH